MSLKLNCTQFNFKQYIFVHQKEKNGLFKTWKSIVFPVICIVKIHDGTLPTDFREVTFNLSPIFGDAGNVGASGAFG